ELKETIENWLNQSRKNELLYEQTIEAGEETMAIPMITDDQFLGKENQETIISQPNDPTRNFPPEKTADKEKNSKKNKKKDKPKKGKNKKWLIILDRKSTRLNSSHV